MDGLLRFWLGVSAVGLWLAAGCGDGIKASSIPDAATGSARLVFALADGQTADFGPLPINATAVRTCTLSNIGTLPTVLEAVSIRGMSADFVVQSSDCVIGPDDVLFPAGKPCSFTIAFSPSAEMPETGTLVATAFNGDMPSLMFTGIGTAAVPIAEYPTPTANSGPGTIAAGSDGALWFAENRAHRIGRITTAAAFTEYPLPIANAALEAVAAGPDGALWYTDADNNQVVRVAVDGTFSTYPTPTLNVPQGIALGPDGAFWVAAYGGTVGRVTTTGVVTGTFAIPTLDAGADAVAAGPDQALWFTEYDAGNIARVESQRHHHGVCDLGAAARPDGDHRRPRRSPLVHRQRRDRSRHHGWHGLAHPNPERWRRI